jgi:hypothetical protein
MNRADQNSSVEYRSSQQPLRRKGISEGCELRATESCRGSRNFCAGALALVADDFKLS